MQQYFFQSRADSFLKTATFLKVSKSMQQNFFQIRKDSFRKKYQTLKTCFHIIP